MVLLSAGPTAAAIQTDNQTSGRCFFCNSLTVPLTVSGDDRLLTIQVAIYGANGSVSVTYDGVAATFLDTVSTPCQGGTACHAALWRLVAPNTGTHNIVVGYSTTAIELVIGGLSQTGVDQTTPNGTVVKGSGTSAVPSITLSSASNEVLVGLLARTSGANETSTPSNGAISNFVDNGSGGFMKAAGSYQTGALAPIYGWTYATSSPYVILAVPVKPAASGGGGGGPIPSTEILLWNDNSTNETTFRLEWKHATQPTYILLASLGPGVQTYTVNYTTETERCYRVRAENTAGNSIFSNELCGAITAPGPISTPLTAPQLGGGLADD